MRASVLAGVPSFESLAGKMANQFMQHLKDTTNLAALPSSPSKLGLYRAFRQELQSSTPGSLGSLVKRLVDKTHGQELQKQHQELDQQEKTLQE